MNKLAKILVGCVISISMLSGTSRAAGMLDYCMIPPFLQAGILPNLLLMLDNSASMFDLAYADRGTSTRPPKYCFDDTFSDVKPDGTPNLYAGYFTPASFYDYDIAAGKFIKNASDTFPAASDCTYYVANKYCITTDSSTPVRVTKFSASGNYLNWLTASKFDVQKKVLTGGKWDSANQLLISESRGCVGRGFIKQPLSTNSGNYVEGGTNTAITLSSGRSLALSIKGRNDSNDATAPSQGGPTSIYFHEAAKPLNYPKCDDAIEAMSTANSMNNEVRGLVLDCIGANTATDLAGKSKQIFQQSLQECWQYYKNSPPSLQGNDYLTVKKFCTDVYNLKDPSHVSTNPAKDISAGDPALLCSDNYVGACYSGALAALPSSSFNLLALLSPKEAFAGAGETLQFKAAAYSFGEATTSINVLVSRTGGSNGKVSVNYATAPGTATAGSDYDTKTGTVTFDNGDTTDKPISILIKDDSLIEGNETFTITLTGSSVGAPSTTTVTIVDNDTVGATGTIGFETAAPPSVNETAGTIVLNVQRLGGSTGAAKVNYATSPNTALAGSDYTTTSGTLSWADGDSATQTITIPIIGDAVAEANETFYVDLSAISGATLGTSRATATITEAAAVVGGWLDTWVSDACVKTQHELYCAGMSVPPVVDPTNLGLDTTSNYNNLPAVIADVAITGQMGAPVKLLSSDGTEHDAATVRLAATEPIGLIQDFKDKIRVGVMSFNYNGSASECGTDPTIPCPKICSNSTDMNFPKTCLSKLDCCTTAESCTCDASTVNTTNRDGAKILHYIGRGICSDTIDTECTADSGCTAPAKCNFVGSHASGLINVINNISASNWTPFSEGYYNAIGYFARKTDGTSRTDLRINSTVGSEDFVGNKHPSIASCQQNNVLIISDGVATADQNSVVNTLAGTAVTLGAGGASGACPSFSGSKNLDKLAWLANKRKINDDSFAVPWVDARDYITTYTAYNGAEISDASTTNTECNSATMMENTATKGGGKFYQAIDAAAMQEQLEAAFDDMSAKVSSGTAAAVANNKSGERGANIIQALFYPKWTAVPGQLEKKWMGDIQALWFYVDPIVKFSGIFEDTVGDKILNFTNDRPPGNDSLTVKALWKAGELLRLRDASNRDIYTLLNSSQPITDAANGLSTVAANRTLLKPLLDMSANTDTQVEEIIDYVRGVDGTKRSREVSLETDTTKKVWKLGDVINSTPQIQGNDGLNKYDIEYGDISYGQFIKSSNYKTNNHVYAGSNDGMLHAFKLGLVSRVREPANPYKIAEITNPTDIGKELWAFIPHNALPYLKNCADPDYCHQFLVDGAPLLFDASINKYTGCLGDYWECDRKTTLSSSALSETTTSWRSILIGSMGLGGATTKVGTDCNRTHPTSAASDDNNKCINTPSEEPIDPLDLSKGTKGLGYSSYFALDVTIPNTPKLLWEFSDASIDADTSLTGTGTATASSRVGHTDTSVDKPATKGLGLTTPGGIQIRINSRKTTDTTKSLQTTNGRWFAVFPSGPTGPIDKGTHQFRGQSDQNLKIYIVDLNPSNSAVPDSTNGAPTFKKCTSAGATGCNYWVIDTGIKFAFANSLFNAAIDIDKGDGSSPSNYSDDVVYITYTKADLQTVSGADYPITSAGAPGWNKGGVLRLITNNDPDPYNWFTSKLIDDIGPVTRSVDILQDKNNNKLWVFFGEARYFFRQDDLNATRRIYGVADPCYGYNLNKNQFTTEANCNPVTVDLLKDQSTSPSASLAPEKKGWYIDLEAADANYGAERLSGGISSRTNGLVLFTTFIPSMDPCDAGGLPSQWAVNFKTGGAAPPGSLQGKVIMTTSDSPIAKTLNLAGAFTERDNRKLGIDISKELKGMPPPSPPPSLILPSPSKRILHIQER